MLRWIGSSGVKREGFVVSASPASHVTVLLWGENSIKATAALPPQLEVLMQVPSEAAMWDGACGSMTFKAPSNPNQPFCGSMIFEVSYNSTILYGSVIFKAPSNPNHPWFYDHGPF